MMRRILRGSLGVGSCAFGLGVVLVGYQSDAHARNNDSNWSEECHVEGCDLEEVREMYVNGSYKEEVLNEWATKGAKTAADAAAEMRELAWPGGHYYNIQGDYCAWMIDDFDHRLHRTVHSQIRTICENYRAPL